MVKLRLVSIGNNKIHVIKHIREFTGLSLKESKDLMDNAPSILISKKENIDLDKAIKEFEAYGAKIELLKATSVPKGMAAGVDDSTEIDKPEPTQQIIKDFDKKKDVPEIKQQSKDIISENTFTYQPTTEKPNLKAAIAFVVTVAIIRSLFFTRLGFTGYFLIFIVFFGVAYFLRKKNPPSGKLGIMAFVICMAYYFGSFFLNWTLFKLIYGGSIPIDIFRIIVDLFITSNILILLAAFGAFFLASNEKVFKSLSAGANKNKPENVKQKNFKEKKRF